jgi:hypothetical protein
MKSRSPNLTPDATNLLYKERKGVGRAENEKEERACVGGDDEGANGDNDNNDDV